VRLIQHKKEAYWFYRFLSFAYDRWINPLFWTPEMRSQALRLARFEDRSLTTLDVGAGTGFTTEGIVRHVAPERVTMLDQSPHQLARAATKPALRLCRRLEGDAEALPFASHTFDRYVSAGSIEYWPEPQRALAEAYRVLRPGGVALIVGPLPPANRAARWLSNQWMLFPREHDYESWLAAAGFTDLVTTYVAPEWHRDGRAPYGLAIAGRKPADARRPLRLPEPVERLDEPMTPARRLRFAGRFLAGSAAGAAFVPIAAALALRARLGRRSPAPWRVAIATGRRAIVARAGTLWRFSRPHTIVGTTVSVIALYAIADAAGRGSGALDLAATLIAAWCVNVAIVGLNQIEDIEIDRVNKPDLPLASGELTPAAAKLIVGVTAVIPVAMAITQGPIELAAVLAALLIGAAYSSPPLRLKRFPAIAVISISLVRALAVNFGVYGHFAGSLADLPAAVWALTIFVLPFSAAIALLKDVPDVEGDRRYRIHTFSVRLGPHRVFAIALALLAAAYIAMAIPVALELPQVSRPVFAAGHLGALALLLVWARRVDPDHPPAFTRFYMRVWQLFFFEYVLVAAGFLAGST
jgi:4-hydroxybenzoate polyprenyltransferase/ubiquinone/menaquinone biosynthesis C-methylase UbiE